jgi:hypothetical protein
MAAPIKVYHHNLEVAFTDEEWTYITELAHIAKAPKSAVVRAFVRQGLAPLRETPMPDHLRERLGPVTVTNAEEVMA